MDQYSLEDSDDAIQLQTAWKQVTSRVASEFTGPAFERFIRPLKPTQVRGDTVSLIAPGRFVQEWVTNKCRGVLEAYLSDELGRSVTIEVNWEARDKGVERKIEKTYVVPAVIDTAVFRPDPKFTFDSYVVGQSNRMAHAGAKAVAAEPGARYNPLFICGPSGLGKTHLMHAIAREIMSRDPKFSVAYLSAQQFAEEFVNALQNNRVDQFRKAQRNVGIWLIDDIQFIAGKDKTTEEVFHTFNHLYSLGKQIVICSDRAPRDLHMMDDRLRSRFEAGLVADIQMPDTETRCAIIQSKAQRDGVEIAHEIAMYLAENVPGNIRQLEGALIKLLAQNSINGLPLDLPTAHAMVEAHYSGRMAKPGFEQIVHAVGETFHISVDDIKGPSRKAPIVEARHVAVYIVRELTHDSWKHIGSLFGDRDHTSMMHGYQKIQEHLHVNKELRATVKTLLRSLGIN
jgi:chromosomal replication initiator protein